MAAEITEQILEAVKTALSGAVPAVGTRVERARVDAIAPAECPFIEIAQISDTADPDSVEGDIHSCSLTFVVAIHVQGGAGVWETVASQIAVLAHPLIVGIALPAGVEQVFGPGSSNFVAAPGDGRPAYRAMTYQATYYRQAAALDTAVP